VSPEKIEQLKQARLKGAEKKKEMKELKSKAKQLPIEEMKISAMKYDQLQKQKEEIIKNPTEKEIIKRPTDAYTASGGCHIEKEIKPIEKEIITKQPKYTTGMADEGITSAVIEEAQNFIPLPDTIIGVNSVFKSDANTISSGMFNVKYQIFLNDLYNFGSLDLLNYAMTKTYLEDISRIITPDVQLRFNKKQHRLYLDIDWQMVDTRNNCQ
jgi:hypothetical protein